MHTRTIFQNKMAEPLQPVPLLKIIGFCSRPHKPALIEHLRTVEGPLGLQVKLPLLRTGPQWTLSEDTAPSLLNKSKSQVSTVVLIPLLTVGLADARFCYYNCRIP